MIDHDYEDRLIDRIAVNEAIAARLNLRQRRVLLRYTRYGETYREIGQREGVSVERIRQLYVKAIGRLRKPLVSEPDRVPPRRTTRNTPPAGFDKAAFLRHMRGLIAQREEQAREHRVRDEEEARNWRKRERAALDRIMRNEEQQGLFDPPLKVAPPPLKPYQPSYYTPATLDPQHWVINSPSYTPPPLPTKDQLCATANDALCYLLLARPQQYVGTPWLGKLCTSVVFTRDGGQVSEAVNSILRELPAAARLSAYPVAVPDGMLGANATTPYASLRVTVTPDGLKMRFDVTWDQA